MEQFGKRSNSSSPLNNDLLAQVLAEELKLGIPAHHPRREQVSWEAFYLTTASRIVVRVVLEIPVMHTAHVGHIFYARVQVEVTVHSIGIVPL